MLGHLGSSYTLKVFLIDDLIIILIIDLIIKYIIVDEILLLLLDRELVRRRVIVTCWSANIRSVSDLTPHAQHVFMHFLVLLLQVLDLKGKLHYQQLLFLSL